MSESLKKLKEIAVVNKIIGELDRALEIKDKVCHFNLLIQSFLTLQVLAEFILDIAKKSPTVDDFQHALEENQAEFSIELINSIYATVTKMLPEYFKADVLMKDGKP